jgi:hypothetical protein
MAFLAPEQRQPTHWQGRPEAVVLDEAIEKPGSKREHQGSHHRHVRTGFQVGAYGTSPERMSPPKGMMRFICPTP